MAARDEHGNTVKRGVYVNATLTDEEQGNRQGVHWDDNSDGSIQVQGELELYHCKPDVTVVPDCNLRFGNTGFSGIRVGFPLCLNGSANVEFESKNRSFQ